MPVLTRMRCFLLLTLFFSTSHLQSSEQVILVLDRGSTTVAESASKVKPLTQPFGIDFVADGSLVFVEMTGGERLRLLSQTKTLTTIAGTGEKGVPGNDGAGSEATFNGLHNLVVAADGKIFLSDTFNHRIRYYDPATQSVHPFSGDGKAGFAGDGEKAIKARYQQPISVALSPDGKKMLIADIGNRRIRAIDMETLDVSTVAGNGKQGVPKDGELAISQPLQDPRCALVDRKGNLYILERGGHCLRQVDSQGRIRTVAGTGKSSSAVPEGNALDVTFNGPKFISLCHDDSILIADAENHQIKKYLPEEGKVVLIAGCGTKGAVGIGGEPRDVQLARPHGAIEHPVTKEIYIADSDNHRILRIAPASTK